MSENPYQAPPEFEPAVGVKSGRREDLRSVAIYQKSLLSCIFLCYVIGGITHAVTMVFHSTPGMDLIAIGAMIFITIGFLGGIVFVILLSIKVYHPITGVLLVIVMVVPLINLLVLLSINGKATNILKANGIRVGLMGAKLSDVK